MFALRYPTLLAAVRRGMGCAMLGLGLAAASAETIPPVPSQYFLDLTNTVAPGVAEQLNRRLEANEKATSNQIMVVIYPRMDSESSVADYTRRVAESWRVGRAEHNNGAVLFVFREDREIYLQVGYGLEGVLPDALAKRIIDDEIVPRFRNGDFNGGVTVAVDSIIAATYGEYNGTGYTAAQQADQFGVRHLVAIMFTVMLFAAFAIFGHRSRRRVVLGGPGHSTGWWVGTGTGGRGGGGFGGGGFGGGGFSGGGGSFGGGGAGGSW